MAPSGGRQNPVILPGVDGGRLPLSRCAVPVNVDDASSEARPSQPRKDGHEEARTATHSRGSVRQSPRRMRHRGTRSRDVDRKSTRLNSSHGYISYAVFCLKKKKKMTYEFYACEAISTTVSKQP